MTQEAAEADGLRRVAAVPLRERLEHRVAAIPNGIAETYRDALTGRRLAWASPAVFTVCAYIGFYGVGLVLSSQSPRLPTTALAFALGLAGILAGIGLGWGAVSGPAQLRSVDRSLLARYALLLLGLGVAALIAYFLVIGYIPLFQPSLEQSRVDAAEEGGAPLRVLSLLALPGTWILVAQAAAGRDRRAIVLAALAIIVVALGFTLTANRSPVFLLIEVGFVAALLGAGKDRLGGRGIALLAVLGLVLVLGAGAFGAFRLGSRSATAAPNYPALTAIAIKGYLVVPIQNLDYTMDAVPDRIGWRFGLTYLQPLLTVLPGKQTTFDADLKTALNQHYAGGGTVPGLLGEAFANFGPLGWFLVPFLVGMAITALYRKTREGAPELIVLYAYAIIHVSIGGILSGLSMASILPFEAYAVMGFAIFGLPIIERRIARRGE